MKNTHDCLADSIRSVAALEQQIQRSIPDTSVLRSIAEKHPLRVTPYYLDLIDWDDPDDPIRKIAIPSSGEQNMSGSFDTSGELHNTKLPGLQHKYRETALILATNICSVYCRHCFRKRLIGVAEDEVVTDWDKVTAYLHEHKELTNVLLSGGDPLVLETEYLADILERLSAVEHLQYIRIGTRTPVVVPQRISEDDALHEHFRKFLSHGKQLYITAQYNHARELTPASIEAIARLRENGIIVNNQAVLLKGVNDSPDVLAELKIALARAGVIPYYLFQCRPVTSVKEEFQVPFSKACRIVDEARSGLDGLSKRFRFVMAHPTGKIEILGWNDGKLFAKYLQTNRKNLHNKIFQKSMTEDEGWLDMEAEECESPACCGNC